MKKTFFFVAILSVIFVSCSNNKDNAKKETSTISFTINAEDLIGSNFILEENIRGKLVASDTIKIKSKKFSVKIKKDSVTIRNLYAPNKEFRPIPIAMENGDIKVDVSKDYQIKLGGTDLNKILQKRADEEVRYIEIMEAVSKEREKKKSEGKLTKEEQERYTKEFDRYIDENLNSLIAYIKQNIENPVGKYYFYRTFYLLPYDKKQEMMSFATPDIKESYNNR